MTPFDVVLVPFHFTDLSQVKKRPCLVLAVISPKRLNLHCVVAMMTSNRDGLSFPHDIELHDWEAAGLPKPTLARLDKLVTLDAKLILRKLGNLSKKDRVEVRRQGKRLFSDLLGG